MPRLSGLHFDRPWGLLGLLVPLVFLVLCRRRLRPSVHYAANLGLWAAVLRKQEVQAKTRGWNLSLAQASVFAALVLAAVALAEPRTGGVAGTKAWTIVLDPRPSMGLVDRGSSSRLERGVEAAEAWIAKRIRGADGVQWIRFTSRGEERAHGPAAPPSWRSQQRSPAKPPSFREWDRPGVLWVSDTSPDPEGRGTSAAWIAVGAEVSPGPVAVIPAERDPESPSEAQPHYLEWDGEAWVVGGVPELRGEVLLGAGVPESLRVLAEAWAEDRGLSVSERQGPGQTGFASLVLEGPEPHPPEGGESTFRSRLPNLELAGRVDSAGLAGLRALRAEGGEALLEGFIPARPDPCPLIVGSPGRLTTAILALDDFDGDSVAWPVFLGTQFDRFRLPDPELLPLADRARSGPPGQGEGQPPASLGALPPRRWSVDLATLGALLLFLGAALTLGARGPRVSRG